MPKIIDPGAEAEGSRSCGLARWVERYPRCCAGAGCCTSRINLLIGDIERHGNEGIGKPEPLKHGFHGYWSRPINDEHRLVYKVVDDKIRIAACRYHYSG